MLEYPEAVVVNVTENNNKGNSQEINGTKVSCNDDFELLSLYYCSYE